MLYYNLSIFEYKMMILKIENFDDLNKSVTSLLMSCIIKK